MKLAELMERKGYSFRDLSDASGIAVSAIALITNGTTKTPYPSTMRKIAQVLEVDIEEIDEFADALRLRRLKEHPLVALNPQGVLKEIAAVRAAALSVS